MLAWVDDAPEIDTEALGAAWLLACGTQREGEEEEGGADGGKLAQPRMKGAREAKCSRAEKGHGVGGKDLTQGIRWCGGCDGLGHACALSQNTASTLVR